MMARVQKRVRRKEWEQPGVGEMKSENPLVFVSHAAKEDKDLAAVFRDWILLAYRHEVDVFVSSKDGIPVDMTPVVKIQEALEKAALLIVLHTPDSVGKQWLTFESAWARGEKKHAFHLLCGGVEAKDIASPITSMIQLKDTRDAEQFFEVIESMDAVLGKRHKREIEHLRISLSENRESIREEDGSEKMRQMQNNNAKGEYAGIVQINHGDKVVQAAGNVNIRMTRGRKAKAAVPLSGVIGTSPNERAYIQHLYNRLFDYKIAIPGYDEAKAGRIIARYVRDRFGTTWSHVPISQFNSLVELLQQKIEETPIGRLHKKNGTKSYSSFEEFQNR